jgi:hypothetical protein
LTIVKTIDRARDDIHSAALQEVPVPVGGLWV